jgi:thioredoxin 1
MWSLIPWLLAGGGIGTALGYYGKCSSGTCPLTSTWWRGAIYGAVLGGLFYFTSGASTPAALNKSMANVQPIKEDEFDADVVQSTLPVVVDFYATWCGPCKLLAPTLDELAGPLASKIKFVKINVDEAPALSQRFDIQAIPTLIFFKQGKVVDHIVGLPSVDDLKAQLDTLAGPGAPAKKSGRMAGAG